MHRTQPSLYPSAYPKSHCLSEDDVRKLQEHSRKLEEHSRKLTQKWVPTHLTFLSLLYLFPGASLSDSLSVSLPSYWLVFLCSPSVKERHFLLCWRLICIRAFYWMFCRICLKVILLPLSPPSLPLPSLSLPSPPLPFPSLPLTMQCRHEKLIKDYNALEATLASTVSPSDAVPSHPHPQRKQEVSMTKTPI